MQTPYSLHVLSKLSAVCSAETPLWIPTPCKCSPLSRVQVFVTPWSVAHQASLSMGFSRQEHWSGLPFPSPGYLPDPDIEPRSPALQADSLPTS